jgi:hypothetical protein
LLAYGAVARADPATDLLYFSSDLISGRGYAGVGWMHAVSGLDASGLVFSAEGGKPEWRETYGAAQAGWRFVQSGVYLTLMGGLDAEPRLHPLVSADLWWELTPALMSQAFFEAASGWTSWRVATGWRPDGAWPWFGPEAAASAGWPRAGLHATGIKLIDGVEARLSAGVSWREGRRAGPYGEISVWRRF